MNRRILLPVTLVLVGVLIALAGYAVATLARPVTPVPSRGDIIGPDETPRRDGVAYLAALRAMRVPVSAAGAPEILIARGVCDQLAAGTPEASLLSDLTRMSAPLADWDTAAYYAFQMVESAKANYC